MAVHDKLNKLIKKYGSDNEESLVKHLKIKFSKEYKLASEDLKNGGPQGPPFFLRLRKSFHVKILQPTPQLV